MIETFLELEEKYNLLNDKFEDYSWWMYNRFNIFSEMDCIISHHPEISSKKLGKNFMAQCFKLLKPAKNNYKKTALLVLGHPRRVLIDGKYRCVYTDFIRNDISDSITLETTCSLTHYTPTYVDDIFYIDKIETEAILYKKILGKIRGKDAAIKRYIKDKLQGFFYELENEFSIQLNKEPIYNRIVQGYFQYKFAKCKIENIIKRISPKVIVETVYYGFYYMLINEIASKMNVPTIELQHGTMGENHVAYNFKKKQIIEQFPDYVFTFSPFWNNNTRFPIDNVYAVGFPRLEDNVMQYNSIKNQKAILFISQNTVGDKLSEFAVEFSKMAVPKGYKIYYKLHPGEVNNWEIRYNHLAQCKDITVIGNENGTIYELFGTCAIQFGVYSTAIYEGLAFGLDTYIVELFRHEDMKQLYESGYAKLVSSPEEAVACLQTTNKSRQQEISFWEFNSEEKIINKIREIGKL